MLYQFNIVALQHKNSKYLMFINIMFKNKRK